VVFVALSIGEYSFFSVSQKQKHQGSLQTFLLAGHLSNNVQPEYCNAILQETIVMGNTRVLALRPLYTLAKHGAKEASRQQVLGITGGNGADQIEGNRQ
jgi:hypothetical protein